MDLSFKQSDCTCSDALNCCLNENRNWLLKHFAVPLPISTGTNQSLWCYDRIIITRSIPWPVMPRQLISNHANSLCTINRTPFSARKNFNYMCHIVGRKCRFLWLYQNDTTTSYALLPSWQVGTTLKARIPPLKYSNGWYLFHHLNLELKFRIRIRKKNKLFIQGLSKRIFRTYLMKQEFLVNGKLETCYEILIYYWNICVSDVTNSQSHRASLSVDPS